MAVQRIRVVAHIEKDLGNLLRFQYLLESAVALQSTRGEGLSAKGMDIDEVGVLCGQNVDLENGNGSVA